MSMRITTKMMQNTAMNNLNTNKTLQEKLTTQLSTKKKLTRPSDDPVVAIRSLKLNSELTKTEQYYEKNTNDALNWLELTESSVDTVNEILIDIKEYVTQCANGDLTASDRSAILENISNYVDEIYSTGDTQNAGRYLFTGYRTDTALTVQEDKTEKNTITEQVNNLSISTVTHVVTGDIVNINEGNFNTDAYKSYTEYDITSYDVARIRLSYDNLDAVDSDSLADGSSSLKLSYFDDDGNEVSIEITATYENDDDAAYEEAAANENAVVYIAETGEILLGSAVQNKLAALSADNEIRITYDKTDWVEGDLDPVHYFYTERVDNDTQKTLVYNEEKLSNPLGNTAQQVIEYDVGNSQSIRVNTTADEVFSHDMGRDVDELVELLEEYDSLDDTYNNIKSLIDSGKYDGDDLDTLNLQLSAIDKARTYAKDTLQSRAESMETSFDNYIDQAKLATTDIGSRESRVKLVQNRLSSQKTSYEELVSDNEDADIAELAVQLSSVQLTYEAALSSISYVMKTTLLDYI